MTHVELERLTWPEAERLAQAGAVGLVTLAALEQHGPHLPLATDALLGEVVARAVADRLPGPVLTAPVLRAGLSSHHLPFPGTVDVPEAAYRGLVRSYLEALERTGVGKIALWSSHGGNFGLVAELAAGYEGEARVAGYSDLGRFLAVMVEAARRAGIDAAETDMHAGVLETSLMLAARPDLVRPFARVEGYIAAEPGWIDRVLGDGVRPLSASGVLGSPAGASAGAGEAILAALVDELASFFVRELAL